MKKSRSYAPYIYAFITCAISILINNRAQKPGFVLVLLVYFFALVGMWRLIEWLLSLSDNKLEQLVSVLLGSTIFIIVFIGLDFYVLHLLMNFVEFTPLDLSLNLFLNVIITTIFIESKRWGEAGEKVEIENLHLQAENIEAKFELLKKQVNPEFLFYCLATLQTMVKSNDPQIETYILKLADVYRRLLKQQNNIVGLREELTFLQTYMFLMRYGRETAISFEVNVLDESLYYDLPIFALQLLGDNCIKHNEFSESYPLHICIFQKDAQSITITNNYQRRVVPKSFGIDMEHLEMRYAMEGIENGVFIEKETATYSTTIKLF